MSKIAELPPHHLITRIPAAFLDNQDRRIAKEIGSDFAGAEVSLITVLRGAKPFATNLALYLGLMSTTPSLVRRDEFRVESYGDKPESNGDPKVLVNLANPADTIMGRDVILVEDIVDKGYTMFLCALPYIWSFQPKSLVIASMLTMNAKRDPIAKDLPLRYYGEDIDFFAVGRGLDWLEQYRWGLDVSEVVTY